MTPVTISIPRTYDDMRKCLRDLGYTSRRGKHEVWSKDGQPNFTLPLTPSDRRSLLNDLARLKRQHPEAFEATNGSPRERVRLAAAPVLPEAVAAQVRERKREARNALRSVSEALETDVPDPGTDAAHAAGCLCPRDQKYYEAIPSEGIFAEVKHCPLHGWHDEPEPEVPVAIGFDKYERRSRGRPVGSGRSPGCAQCGDPSAARVSLALERHPKHIRVASHAIAFCESCAVDVFDALLAAFGESYESPKEKAA